MCTDAPNTNGNTNFSLAWSTLMDWACIPPSFRATGYTAALTNFAPSLPVYGGRHALTFNPPLGSTPLTTTLRIASNAAGASDFADAHGGLYDIPTDVSSISVELDMLPLDPAGAGDAAAEASVPLAASVELVPAATNGSLSTPVLPPPPLQQPGCAAPSAPQLVGVIAGAGTAGFTVLTAGGDGALRRCAFSLPPGGGGSGGGVLVEAFGLDGHSRVLLAPCDAVVALSQHDGTGGGTAENYPILRTNGPLVIGPEEMLQLGSGGGACAVLMDAGTAAAPMRLLLAPASPACAANSSAPVVLTSFQAAPAPAPAVPPPTTRSGLVVCAPQPAAVRRLTSISVGGAGFEQFMIQATINTSALPAWYADGAWAAMAVDAEALPAGACYRASAISMGGSVVSLRVDGSTAALGGSGAESSVSAVLCAKSASVPPTVELIMRIDGGMAAGVEARADVLLDTLPAPPPPSPPPPMPPYPPPAPPPSPPSPPASPPPYPPPYPPPPPPSPPSQGFPPGSEPAPSTADPGLQSGPTGGGSPLGATGNPRPTLAKAVLATAFAGRQGVGNRWQQLTQGQLQLTYMSPWLMTRGALGLFARHDVLTGLLCLMRLMGFMLLWLMGLLAGHDVLTGLLCH
eukprot:365268-Chlamydomonas_euryale.AAC.15